MATPNECEFDQRSAAGDREVSPRMQGLALGIQEAVRQLRHRDRDRRVNSTDHDGLLFLGHGHDTHPCLVFHDPVLEPVDKVVWAVLRQQAEVGDTAFPHYQTLARLANIGSKATVARALMILRLTRWLSLCARVRDEQGRFQGNVYALHDEPLSVGDALHLDPDYLPFVQAMQQHHHDQVKRVAAAVLATIEEVIAEGRAVTPATTRHPQQERRWARYCGVTEGPHPAGYSRSPDNPSPALDRSAAIPAGAGQYREAAHRVQNLNSAAEDRVQNLNSADGVQKLNSAAEDHVQNLNSADGVQKLNSAAEDRVQNLNSAAEILEKQPVSTQVQNLNAVSVGSSYQLKTTTTTTTPSANLSAAEDRVQNLNSAAEILEKQPVSAQVQNLNAVSVGSSSSSSSDKTKTTTTTTTPSADLPVARTGKIAWETLHFPPHLSPDEVILAKMYLGRLSDGLHQDVLDELQGRLAHAGHSAPPIRNPIGYLAQLCHAVKTDTFQLTSAGLHARQAREHAAARQQAQAQEEHRYRQALLDKPPPASPLVKRIMVIREQVQARRRGATSSASSPTEDQP